MSLIMDWLTYLTYSLLWRLVRLLPESSAYQLFNMFASRAHRRNGKRVQRLRENFRMVRPGLGETEIESMVISGLQNSMRYWCDTFRISDWDSQRVIATTKTVRAELLFEGLENGKGVIIALPHAGNWDHAGLYFSTLGVTVHTVAEHLKPDRLFKKFLAHRAAMGLVVLDIEDRVIDRLGDVLRAGGLVALVADRDLSKSGIDVEFFGANARMPAGPALLAYRTGARLITAYVSYRENGIEVKFSGPFEISSVADEGDEVLRATQAIAGQFESDIKDDPTSWHMLQRIFVEKISEQR